MAAPFPPAISRRALLAGLAGTAILAACGDDDGATPTSSTATTGSTTTTAPEGSLVQFFGNDYLVPGREQRLTFGLGDADGVVTDDVPARLEFRFAPEGGRQVGETVAARSRQGTLPRPYYAVPFNFAEAGLYVATSEWNGQEVATTFEVVAPEASRIKQVGDPMVVIDTPTAAAPLGVDPICTDTPPCPLHDVSLRQALTETRPLALLVSTPKFCQVAICGPVLDVLRGQSAAFPNVRMLHAEVFTDETTQTTTEAVRAFGLTFEPCLFVARPDGTISARLDNIYDETELAAALTVASA